MCQSPGEGVWVRLAALMHVGRGKLWQCLGGRTRRLEGSRESHLASQ